MRKHHKLCDLWVRELAFEIMVRVPRVLRNVREASLNYAFDQVIHCAVGAIVEARNRAFEDGADHIDVRFETSQDKTPRLKIQMK